MTTTTTTELVPAAVPSVPAPPPVPETMDRDILDWLSTRLDGDWSDPAGLLEDLAVKLRQTGRTAGCTARVR